MLLMSRQHGPLSCELVGDIGSVHVKTEFSTNLLGIAILAKSL